MRDGTFYAAIAFGDRTGGIGIEPRNWPVEGVLKPAMSVGYCFCVNTRGVEIERASPVETSLEQKHTKGAKVATFPSKPFHRLWIMHALTAY
jgi:hypothetical protein